MAKQDPVSMSRAASEAFRGHVGINEKGEYDPTEVEESVQAQNRSEHVGGEADGDSGPVNPDTVPTPDPAGERAAFRVIDAPTVVADESTPEQGKTQKAAKKAAAKKTASSK